MKNLMLLLIFFLMLIGCSKFECKEEDNLNDHRSSAGAILSNDTSFGIIAPMAEIAAGSYVPLYGVASKEIVVKNISMDIYPVTNADYHAFVKKNVRWRRSKVKKLFADSNYLTNWMNDTTLGQDMKENSPVTNISWYAANAYCECQGKRMATVDEWEYVAMSNEDIQDARKLKTYNQYILDWYEKPKTYLDPIGNTFRNYWGVYDMHGLVWEWTSDFNSVLLTGESRNDVALDKNLFCGSGSLTANDLMNYAAFMRYAFRGSLKADYSVQNLGFRCVSDSINFKMN